MTVRINEERVAVDDQYYWRDMSDAPLGVKVQLLNPGGVAVYGEVTANTRMLFNGWAPLPKIRREE